MSKQWFFQAMGAEIGPVSSAELKERVHLGQIQAETLVRLGDQGPWMTADRIKGLIEKKPEPVVPPQTPTPSVAAPVVKAPVIKADTVEHDARHVKLMPGAVAPAASDAPLPLAGDDDSSTEYDFFRLVGFENALGGKLHQRLVDHCKSSKLGMTEITKRALDQYLTQSTRADRPVLNEVARFTENINALADFYERFLNQPPVERSQNIALFQLGEATLLIHRLCDQTDENPPGENHLGFCTNNVDLAARDLESRGVSVLGPPQDYDWGRSAYIRDPEGALLELCQHRDGPDSSPAGS